MHTFVTSRLDHCNALLSGLLKNTINQQQLIQNSAAWVLSKTRMRANIVPALKSLRSLHTGAMANKWDENKKICKLKCHIKTIHNGPFTNLWYSRHVIKKYSQINKAKMESKSSSDECVWGRFLIFFYHNVDYSRTLLIEILRLGERLRVFAFCAGGSWPGCGWSFRVRREGAGAGVEKWRVGNLLRTAFGLGQAVHQLIKSLRP